jgi:hypothetical protein
MSINPLESPLHHIDQRVPSKPNDGMLASCRGLMPNCCLMALLSGRTSCEKAQGKVGKARTL